MVKLNSIRAVSFLWFGSFMGAGLAFLTQIMLARTLGSQGYGAFSSALAAVLIIAPLAGFGVPALWLKVFGSYGWGGVSWVQPSLFFVRVSTVFSLGAVCLWALLGAHERDTALLLFILSSSILGQVSMELVSAKLQLEERYVELALFQATPHILRFSFVALLYFLALNSKLLAAAAYAVVSFGLLGVCLVSLRRLVGGNILLKGHGDINLAIHRQEAVTWLDVARNSWPFGLAALAHLIYYQIDLVMIKYISGDKVAGYYGVAFTIMTAVYIFPSVLYQKFLMPKIHRWAEHDRSKFREVYHRGNYAMLGFGLMAMVSVWVLSDIVILTLFGEEYTGAAAVLKVLSISSPIISVALSAGATLVTKSHIRVKVFYMCFVAVINVAMNMYAIPNWGAMGAAVTTVLSNALLLVLYLYGAEKRVFCKEFQ